MVVNACPFQGNLDDHWRNWVLAAMSHALLTLLASQSWKERRIPSDIPKRTGSYSFHVQSLPSTILFLETISYDLLRAGVNLNPQQLF